MIRQSTESLDSSESRAPLPVAIGRFIYFPCCCSKFVKDDDYFRNWLSILESFNHWKKWTTVLFRGLLRNRENCIRTLRVINWISDVIYYTPTIYADICSCEPKVTTDIERCENDICQSWHDNVMFKTSFSRNRGIAESNRKRYTFLCFWFAQIFGLWNRSGRGIKTEKQKAK